MTIIFASGFTHYGPEKKFPSRPAQARARVDDPIFGPVVDFGVLFGDIEKDVREWLDLNVGDNGRDFQMRNNRVSFVRSGDADLCYLAFA